jgi:hypothetical protein
MMKSASVVAVSIALCIASSVAYAANPAPAATPVTPITKPTVVAPATLYTARPPAAVTTGRYIMRLRLSSVNGTAVQTSVIHAVPVVIGAKDGKVGVGGKYGPQIAGSLVNGSLSASGRTPGGATFALTGSTSGGALGRFSISRGSLLLAGEYVLDPVTNTSPGETTPGVGTTSGFSSMGWATNWNQTTNPSMGGTQSNVQQNGTTGYSNGTTGAPTPVQNNNFAANSAAVAGMNGTYQGNQGPNFAGSAVSGWYSDDGDPSPVTSINPSTAGGPSTSTDTSTKDPGSKVQQYKDPSSGGGSSKTDNSSFDWSHPIDSAQKWWNGFKIGGQKEGNPTDDGSHNAGTSGSSLNFGRLPTAGGDTNGNTTETGKLNKPSLGGDNPFEVGSADVLNANKLINGASDPLIQH